MNLTDGATEHADASGQADLAPANESGVKPARSPMARAIAWALSVAAHAALIVAAVFIVWNVQETEPDRPPVSISFDEPSYAPAEVVESASQRASAEVATDPVEEAEQRLREPMPPAEDQPEATDAMDALLAEASPPALRAPRPKSEPSQKIEPSARTVRFSGAGASDARDIVYVVDASGSMVTTLPEVVGELRRSIRKLHPTQRFQILMFRQRPGRTGAGFDHPDFTPGVEAPVLIDATRDNKQNALAWLAELNPGGRSNPMPALQAALRMAPDAVFVLSSGASDAALLGAEPDELLARLDELNPEDPDTGRRPVVIKTIEVIEQDPDGLLRRIGEAHGGDDGHRFLSREQLDERASESEDGAP